MKKYLDLILINTISLIIGIGLYYIAKENVEILAAVIATGISLSLGIRHYRTENDKLFKELFTEFNERYDTKFNNELAKINEKSLDPLYEVSSSEKELIIDYLNFCAEEFLWKTKGRIPEYVWKSWENGMIYYLSIPSINKVFMNEVGQKDSYYGLIDYLKSKLK